MQPGRRALRAAGHAQTPPVLSTETTRKIVRYHASALQIIHALPSGWKGTLETGLNELLKDLPANEAKALAPYVLLVKSVLAGVN